MVSLRCLGGFACLVPVVSAGPVTGGFVSMVSFRCFGF